MFEQFTRQNYSTSIHPSRMQELIGCYERALRDVGEEGAIHEGLMGFEILIVGPKPEVSAQIPLNDICRQYYATEKAGRHALLMQHASSVKSRLGRTYPERSLEDISPALRPILLHESHLHLRRLEFQSLGADVSGYFPVVGKPWMSELNLWLIEITSKEGDVRFIQEDELRRWGADIDAVVDRAVENAGQLPSLQWRPGAPFNVFEDDPVLISAMLLGASQRTRLAGYAVLPLTDASMIMVRYSQRRARGSVEAMRSLPQHLMELGLGPGSCFSGEPLVLHKQQWKAFDLPEACAQAYDDLKRYIRLERYRLQEKFLIRLVDLQNRNDPQGCAERAMPAPIRTRELSAERHLLVANWPRSGSVLLPEVDVVTFMNTESDGDSRPRTVRWPTLLRHAAGLLAETSGYPRRWRTQGYPSEEQFSRMGV